MWEGKIEGDLVPFKMTEEQRRIACEKLSGGASRQTAEWDGVQLFRARPGSVYRGWPPHDSPKVEEPPRPHKCPACGHTLKKLKKPKVKKDSQDNRLRKWWLYYGPGRMTGGFPTKKEAMSWYLKGGR